MTRSARQIAAGQIRSLRAIREKLLDMSYQWADVDEYNKSALSDLADKTETVACELFENGDIDGT